MQHVQDLVKLIFRLKGQLVALDPQLRNEISFLNCGYVDHISGPLPTSWRRTNAEYDNDMAVSPVSGNIFTSRHQSVPLGSTPHTTAQSVPPRSTPLQKEGEEGRKERGM